MTNCDELLLHRRIGQRLDRTALSFGNPAAPNPVPSARAIMSNHSLFAARTRMVSDVDQATRPRTANEHFSIFRERSGGERVTKSVPMPKNTKDPPSCEACGRATSLVRSERHPKFANMLLRVFVCRCGTSTSDIVAETSRRPALSASTTTTAIQGA
ncbi:MAG: hypothetical protein GEU95_14875 [Rhizobiales bacterium]|nr:hypothetical protein [Hyphomicrobiales bacterium]